MVLINRFLRDIADSYPSITRLYSIGSSVQGRDLWVMEIFVQPGQHVPGVPEFKYVANMHGNEVVGKEMLLLLTKYICEHYLLEPRITTLVNTTRMHFLYSMNPDGYEISRPNDNGLGRENANGVDLNRNFPDQYGTDKHNRVAEPEVSAVMNWTLSLPFVLSANLHGGALVANYPFDDNENDFNDPFSRNRLSNLTRKLNPTEDNAIFRHLALVYSQAHPTMHLGEPCALFKLEHFENGITNGAQWYSVTGGMQDWNYVRAGVMELTIEMGCAKYPPVSELPQYWKANREPLIKFIEQVHYGVHGFIRSSISTPVAGAMISLNGSRHGTYSATYGDYWKLTLPGRHNVTIVADGFTPEREQIEIPDDVNRSIRLDVTLMRDDPQHWASANDYRIISNVVHTRYHTDAELREQMAEFETRNGLIATFGYAENEFGAYYNSIKLTSDIGEPEESKYKLLIVSSLFDSASPLGREITINLIRHVIEGHKIAEPSMQRLLQRSVLYFLPLAENFDEVFQLFNANNSICDPIVGNDLASRILSPETEKRRDLFMQFMETSHFDLMLTFTAGNSELSYPKGDHIYEKFARSIEATEFSFSPLQCDATSTRVQHQETNLRLTNMFYKLYNTPMFTLGLSCCRMPEQQQIASIWRKNLEKIRNFLRLLESGVEGRVQDDKGEPVRRASVRLNAHNLVHNVTKNAARFQIILPAGTYSLEVSAPNFETRVEQVIVTEGQILHLGVVTLTSYTLLTGHSDVRMGSATLQDAGASISGFVLDAGNHPISNAKVSIILPKTKHYLRNFTDSLGAYIIRNIPVDAINVTLLAEAPRHIDQKQLVHAVTRGVSVHGVVFRLERNESVLGLPRFVFIVIASILIIAGVVLCVICAQMLLARSQRTDRRYYNFSLLPQKSKALFEDDVNEGDDGETELFRSPIKKGMSIKPYFDEDNVEHILDTDDEDFNNDSGEEIIMLEKRAP